MDDLKQAVRNYKDRNKTSYTKIASPVDMAHSILTKFLRGTRVPCRSNIIKIAEAIDYDVELALERYDAIVGVTLALEIEDYCNKQQLGLWRQQYVALYNRVWVGVPLGQRPSIVPDYKELEAAA